MNSNIVFQWLSCLAFVLFFYIIDVENKRIVKLEENQKFLISYVKELQHTNNSQLKLDSILVNEVFKKQIKEGSK